MQSIPAVVVDDARKSFHLPHREVHTLKERVLHPLRRSSADVLHALKGVSFEVQRGEFFGIVGRNGSGKSTLLKCLAGIYGLDEGAMYVDGRLSTFIELGVGFNPDLPARDNVLLNALMLGLSPREAARRFDEVIAFAELEDFVDLKLKNYSSGMEVRLAFSVLIQVDADILLIDEVLAVGDASFQQKCFDEFARIRRSGRTVLLVTHDMGAVQRFCDRAILLEHGETVHLGDTDTVAAKYLELNFSERARADAAAGVRDEEAPERQGDGRAEILDGWFEDADGARTEALPAGARCAFAARVRFHAEVRDPLFGLNLLNSRGDNLLSASNLWSAPESGTFAEGEELVFRVGFENILSPDRYWATPAVARGGGAGLAWLDRRERLASVVVTGTRPTDALVDMPYELELVR
ncbi:MAG: ABC transporter ATP-binding protein [Solirubrobacterales bacterium]|nr:ABC transporter ATP-binding protein [Solirubrobacterales bacterium]